MSTSLNVLLDTLIEAISHVFRGFFVNAVNNTTGVDAKE